MTAGLPEVAFITDSSTEDETIETIKSLVLSWRSKLTGYDAPASLFMEIEESGLVLLRDASLEDKVIYGLISRSWQSALIELRAGLAYFSLGAGSVDDCSNLQENELSLTKDADFCEAARVMMQSLEDLLKQFTSLSSASLAPYAVAYLGGSLLLALQLARGKLTVSTFVPSHVKLTETFHQKIVGLRAGIYRQRLTQELTAKALLHVNCADIPG